MTASRRGILTAGLAALAVPAAPQRPARAFSGDLADAPFIEAFGPVGTPDDTATFVAALNSGAPVRLRAATYRVRGPVRVRSPVVMMHGVPGLSRIVATGLDTGVWFRIESDGLVDFHGITWDGNGAATGNDVGAVAILGTPQTCGLRRCTIRRAINVAGLLLSHNLDGFDEPMLVLDEVQALVYVYLPFAVLALYASLDRFDFTQLTAAQDLGARADQAFRHILLPQIRPGIITACIFVFIPILGEFLTPIMVGGANGYLIANLISNFFKNALIPEGAAVAFMIVVLVTLLLVVFRRYLRIEDVVARG